MPTSLGTPNHGSCSKSLQGVCAPGLTGDSFLIWGRGLLALLCLGPLEQKMGVQEGTLHWGKYQFGIGSLAQEELHFQGPVGDSLCPLHRGDPVPPTRVMLTARGLFLTPSLLHCLRWGCWGWAELCCAPATASVSLLKGLNFHPSLIPMLIPALGQ